MNIYILLILTIAGLIFGTIHERLHYKSISEREGKIKIPIQVHEEIDETIHKTRLITGSVVIAQDYFKGTLFSLQNIFGGRIIGYERLLDRARREAVLRLHDEALKLNADAIINVRLESSKVRFFCTEAIAYGTAIKYAKHEHNSAVNLRKDS